MVPLLLVGLLKLLKPFGGFWEGGLGRSGRERLPARGPLTRGPWPGGPLA